MQTIGSQEAKQNLPKLIDQVLNGEEITITRHGVPVAKLVPTQEQSEQNIRHAILEIERLSEFNTLDGLSMKELINEGRRF